GYAYFWVDPDQAEQVLNEGVKRSNTPLARAIRAEARLMQADRLGDMGKAEGALADVRAAREFLAENSYVLSVSLKAHLVAANLYREAGKPAKQQAEMEDAELDAQALRHVDTLTHPLGSLRTYYEQTDNEPARFDLSSRAVKKSNIPAAAYHFAMDLYRSGQFQEAYDVLERRKGHDFFGDFLRACTLAELHP